MPIFIGDYLADTAHLDTTQHGAYFLLLISYWRAGKPLPDDDAALANISRRTPKQWAALSVTIRGFFKAALIDGRRVLVHKRVEQELLRAVGKYDKKQVALEAANAARKAAAERLALARADGGASGSPNGHAEGAASGAHISESQSEKKEESISAVPALRRIPKNSLNGHREDFDAAYLAFPKHVAPGDAEKAYAAALKRASPEDILAGVLRYAAERKGEEAKYTKAFGPWLRAERWRDETGNMVTLDPEKVANDKDKSDRFLHRGKYAETPT